MKIVFNHNNQLKILIPAIEIDPVILGEKDVPAGLMFKIIEDYELPSRYTRNFWTMEINKDNADGIGITKEEFIKKYPEYKDWAVQ